MSKFFEYFVLSMFYVTSGFLVCAAILLALVLVMFWPLLVWSLDDIVIYPVIVVNSIVLISLLFAYMETKADEAGKAYAMNMFKALGRGTVIQVPAGFKDSNDVYTKGDFNKWMQESGIPRMERSA